MSRERTAQTTNHANGANGNPVGRGVVPAAAEDAISRTEPMTISATTNHGTSPTISCF